ncbi:MAG: hypothetical protein IJ484_06090 [Oscillospiraceae bacterium]|nr:hypothetical protein [Oscillospiraceae bacterium]
MFFTDEIRLIGKTPYTQDALGQFVASGTGRTVFCDLSSVSAEERSGGGHNGLLPTARAKVMRMDYGGESLVEYDGGDILPKGRYKVSRTYYTADQVELYLARKVGN